jgi:cytochrome c peroxidase
MFAKAITEFEFTLVFANAPIDKFARGHKNALTTDQKQGALLFFGRAGCIQCHKVSGQSNEMFSDFAQHVLAVPQIVPAVTNVTFDGPGQNEDFGLEQFTGNANDRYKFRTSPLRNVALQPTFFHNGAFTRLEDAIRHHLDVNTSVNTYSPAMAGLAPDLLGPIAPMAPVLARIDPLVSKPVVLTDTEFRQLVDFVRNGLLDPRATADELRKLVPRTVPSGRPVLSFEFQPLGHKDLYESEPAISPSTTSTILPPLLSDSTDGHGAFRNNNSLLSADRGDVVSRSFWADASAQIIGESLPSQTHSHLRRRIGPIKKRLGHSGSR